MAAPRIDTLRNRLDSTIAALNQVRSELTDLHLVAYSRHHQPDLVGAVSGGGGGRDYALDNHGDPKAREAYRQLGDAVLDACEALESRVRHALAPLRGGEPAGSSRLDQTANATREEVTEALAAQERRRARGEYVPVATQPQRKPKVVDHGPELKALSGAVRKVAKVHRPDRSRMTPLELAAWQRAARP